jgi:hypothetical protein
MPSHEERVDSIVRCDAGYAGRPDDGKPLRGTYSTPPDVEKAIREEARKMGDFFFAASDGKLTVVLPDQMPSK